MNSSFYLTVFIFFIFALLSAGCTDQPSLATQTPEETPSSTSSPTPSPTPFSGTDYQVRINFTDDWHGTVYIDGETTWEIKGFGPKIYEIPGDEIGDKPWHYIIIEATKQSRVYQTPLTIEVLKLGEVVSSISTVQKETSPGYIPPSETLTLGYYVYAWEPHNQNQTSLDHLMNAHNKIPPLTAEERKLRKELVLPSFWN